MKYSTRWASTLEIRHSVLRLLGWSKQPLQWWLHMFLPLQSWWMHSVPHATVCVHGTYVLCFSKEIQWCWGRYLCGGEIKRLVVGWTGTLVKFCQSSDDFDRMNSYGSCLELQVSLYLAVQTRHILQTIWAMRRNDLHISVLQTSTLWFDQSLRTLQASWLPICPLLRNVTLKDMEEQVPWRNDKSKTGRV